MASWHHRAPYVRPTVLVAVYPVLLLLWLLGTWCIATLRLGHPPIPLVDNPLSIGGALFDVMYDSCRWAIVLAVPLFFINAVSAAMAVWSAAREEEKLFHRLFLPAGFAAVTWITAITFVRCDPLNIVRWLMD